MTNRSVKSRISEKAAGKVGTIFKSANCLAHTGRDLGDPIHRSVSQSCVIQPIPERFHRIKFMSVRRQPLDMEPGAVSFDCILGLSAAMSLQVIPDQDDLLSPMMMQSIQEAHHLGRTNTARMEREKPPELFWTGSDQQQANDREGLPVEGLFQDGGLPLWSPGGSHWRPLRETRLVEKTDPGFQPSGFFLMRGQTTLLQWVMAFSLRSFALFAGLCRLHPRDLRIRQACGTE